MKRPSLGIDFVEGEFGILDDHFSISRPNTIVAGFLSTPNVSVLLRLTLFQLRSPVFIRQRSIFQGNAPGPIRSNVGVVSQINTIGSNSSIHVQSKVSKVSLTES